MLGSIIFYLFITVGMINLIHFALYIVGANMYDIREFMRLAKARKTATKPSTEKKYYRKPLVSVVVAAHNESVGIRRMLDSVIASTYRKVEIIIVNDDSDDDTAQVVRNYIKDLHRRDARMYMARVPRSGKLQRRYLRVSRPQLPITLVNQGRTGKGGAVNNGVKNYAKGQLVMTLDGDSVLHPQAIENAVKYFRNPKVVGVAANVRVMDSSTIIGTLQRFEHLIGYRSKKFYTMSNSEFIVGGVASTYRRSVIRRVGFYDTDTQTEDIGLSMKIVAKLGNRNARIIYAADVVAGTEGVKTYRALFKQRYRWKLGMLQNIFKYRSMIGNNDGRYSRMLTMYRLPMAVAGEFIIFIEPLLIAYVIYLSILYHAPGVMLGAYLTITLYILWTLWPDEHLSKRDKMRQSLVAPSLYPIFYIMNAVQVVALVRCIKDYKKVMRKVKVAGHWTSPARVGGAASI